MAASATIELGKPCRHVACCPLPTYEHLVLAGGASHLSFFRCEPSPDGEEAPKLTALELTCTHTGALDVVAWGHDAVASELRLATAGGGKLSLHSINPRAADAPHYEFPLPAELVAGPLRSCCFLEQSPDRIAVTGDACRCAVLQLEAAAKVERIVQLRAPGVAVRAHSREPQQLMIAQEDGQVHFVDLRVPGGRPSLSRGLPPSSLDSGGLRDADWCAAATASWGPGDRPTDRRRGRLDALTLPSGSVPPPCSQVTRRLLPRGRRVRGSLGRMGSAAGWALAAAAVRRLTAVRCTRLPLASAQPTLRHRRGRGGGARAHPSAARPARAWPHAVACRAERVRGG